MAALSVWSWVLVIGITAQGQPPGTLPPAEALRGEPDAGGELRDFVPKMFLVLDEAGNPVPVPGMTFEKLDELLRLSEQRGQPSRLYSIQSVEIGGRVLASQAELTVRVQIELEPTGGSWVTVPLRMSNFHRLGPPDIAGIERYRVDLADEDGGHLLHLESRTACTVTVSMRVVARVTPPPAKTLQFDCPDAPTRVILDIPSPDVVASVIGQGDEVIATESTASETELTLSGRGGAFSIRFGVAAPRVEARPTLESETRLTLDWQQADNMPLVMQDLVVRSSGGDLPAFVLNLPAEASLLQQPSVRGDGPFEVVDSTEPEFASALLADEADSEAAPPDDAPVQIGVLPVEGRGDSRVELSLATQLRSQDGRPGGRIVIRPITVTDAVQQTGRLDVRVPREYRLRWQSVPWVTSQWDETDPESAGVRTYRFRFDRVPFELPMWLSARTRRLRIQGDYRLTLYDVAAVLRLSLRTTGGVPDSRLLPIEVGDWRVESVAIDGMPTNEADQTDGLLEIDLAALPSGGESDQIDIVLNRPLAADDDRIELRLPRIAADTATIGTMSSTLAVTSESDFRFITDLDSSRGIGEVLRMHGPVAAPQSDVGDTVGGTFKTPLDEAIGSSVPGIVGPPMLDSLVGTAGASGTDFESRYAMADISQPVQLVGFLVLERPGVSLQADAELVVEGDQLVEVINWTVYPRSRLRGRLPVRWEGSQPAVEGQFAGDPSAADDGDTSAAYRLSAVPLWSVMVDDRPAALKPDADGQYAIVSEALASGPHRIRFRRTREISSLLSDDLTPGSTVRLAGVALPRPAVSDLTTRGPIRVRLVGDDTVELSARHAPARWTDDLSLSSLPTTELPLRLRRVDRDRSDITVRRALLRTAASRDLQWDQLVALVHGDGLLSLELDRQLSGPGGDAIRGIHATVNGIEAEVTHDPAAGLLVRIPESGSHTLVLHLYTARRATMLADTVNPVLSLPVGTERFYWEVVTPRDDHLIWSAPTLGRAMQWQLDRWRLFREAMLDAGELASWAGAPAESRIPPGNRYLFVGVSAVRLQAVTMSRLMIWLVVGAAVLAVSCLLTYFPRMRHPLLAVCGAVLLAGMTSLLPDASVLAGQVMLLAMLMVAVMAAVGQLLLPRRTARVLTPSGDRSSVPGSTTRPSNGSSAAAALSSAGGSTSRRLASPTVGSTTEAR